MTATYTLLILLAVAALTAALYPFVRAWWKARGARLVTCPETGEPVRVEVDALEAAFHAVLHTPAYGLESCSRWPEKQGCGQECLAQIGATPNGCLVQGILADWYADQSCVFCGKAFGPLHSWDHRPAFLDPEGVTRVWDEVRVEDLPGVLETHRPVCWSCHVTETFIRQHPDLVTLREPHPSHYQKWEM